MSSNQRIFVDAIRRYCRARDIACEVKSQGWLVIMQRGERRHLAFGYDVGLNSAMAHRIANDKSATAEVLAHSSIACGPHTLFLTPALSKLRSSINKIWEGMLDQLESYPEGIVVKPNEGTSGRSVFLVTTEEELERAAKDVFSSHLSLAI